MMNLQPDNKIIDVEKCFAKTTASYLEFEQTLNFMTERLLDFQPEKLIEECRNIQQQKKALEKLDEETLAIIQFAGEEIGDHPMINEYRMAFDRATSACNNLHIQLQSIRKKLATLL